VPGTSVSGSGPLHDVHNGKGENRAGPTLKRATGACQPK
jgi:hypothetical protein